MWRAGVIVLPKYTVWHAEVRVEVSKGTYIRVLAEEAGKRLGCGAHLCALRREAVAGFHISEAIGLDDLESLTLDARLTRLRPADVLLQGVPRVDLDEWDSRAVRQGRQVTVGGVPQGMVRLYSGADGFIGVGRVDEEGVLAPQRLVHEG